MASLSFEPAIAPHVTAVVDLDALRHNVAVIRRSLAPGTEIIACVKANAYGHGLLPVAGCLEAEGIRWLSVASPAEAMALRQAGLKAHVLLFPTIERSDLAPLAGAGVTIGIQSVAEAEALSGAASSKTSAFLKVDSGFGRVGAALGEATAIARRILRHIPGVSLEGVFTHLPFTEPGHVPWVQERLKDFGEVAATIQAATEQRLLIQAVASTGIVCGLDAPGANAVAPGQLLLGLEPAWTSGVTGRASFGTLPVLAEVRTVVGALRTVPPGRHFGRGGGRTATRSTRLGVLPAGYANSLLVQKEGQVARVAGRLAPIISVSLEHAIVDLTGIAAIENGTVALLIDREAGHGVTLDEVARVQGRSPLELLTSLTGRLHYRHSGAAVADAPPDA